MPYVPCYKNDLFISYGHLDNEHDWVTDFHGCLQVRLRELLGTSQLEIWRDDTLRGPDDFPEVIRENVSRAALFISVLTPRYVSPDTYCRKELDCFVAAAGGLDGLRVDMQSRLIRVVKTKLQEVTQPENFNATLGYEFYEEDPERRGIFREYGSRPGMARYEKFVDLVDVLAQELARMLRKMQKLCPAPQGNPRTIFLATTTNDMEARRASILSELKGRGHTVLSVESLPESSPELQATAQALLAKADLSVHLFGRSFGDSPQDKTKSYGELLYELAFARREHPGFHQLVWIPEDLKNPQATQQAFLDTVRGRIDPSASGRGDVYETSFESFKEGLLDLVSRKPEAASPPPPPTNAKAVYLLCDQPDLAQPELEKIKAYLRSRGHPVDLPPFQGEPEELREMEEELIGDTDAALIYYGTAKDLWVMRKRKNVMKMLSKKQTGPDYARALYLSMPTDEFKKAYLGQEGDSIVEGGGFKPLLILGDCGEFQPSKLDPFIELIEKGA